MQVSSIIAYIIVGLLATKGIDTNVDTVINFLVALGLFHVEDTPTKT